MTNPDEADTRAAHIDVQLREAGWSHPTTIDFEVEYEVGAHGEADHGFADYALPGSDGTLLAIVEAKRSSRDAIAGKEQAKQYVDAIYERTGTRPFVFLANGLETWFWDLASNPRRVGGFFTHDDLVRRRFQLDHRLFLQDVAVNPVIVERPYQHAGIARAHEWLQQGRRKLLWVMATGTGKTRAATAFVDTLLRARWAQRVLFLVDRDELAKQALHDGFGQFLPGEPAERISSSTYESSKRLYVATLQTMQDFYTEFSAGAFDVVISDECHRSIYNKWEAVLTHFDALLLGLTATPADFIDRNTFDFFGCADKTPTFSYEFEQAVADGYLTPFEVYHARTAIQLEGIHGADLAPEVQAELIEQGIDPEDLDFAGTDLERRVTNKETTRLLVREFFENALTEPGGNLPAKSIVFALSHAHARRLWETFNEEYPQFPGLAEIIDSHMERPGAILDRFKKESLPRIAISIDMLDTGVDVPTILNLGFMKPVFSRIKFWQMIGRGARTVDDAAAKPWCPAGSKSVFRILDFWETFQRFQINPEGAEPSATVPVAVRRFRVLIRLVRAAPASGHADLRSQFMAEAREMISDLPLTSAGVREERRLVEEVSGDQFWLSVTDSKFRTLLLQVAPLMRYLAGVDLSRLTYDVHCLEAILAQLEGDVDRAAARAAAVREDLIRLPLDHPELSARRADLVDRHDERWTQTATLDEIMTLRERYASLMYLRQPQPVNIITLNLADAFKERRWIVVGPEAKEFQADAYRELVERRLQTLADSDAHMRRLAASEPLTDADLDAIAAALNQPDLYVTEDALRAAYHAPHGSFVGLLRHALGVERLPTREAVITESFEAFVSDKGYLDDAHRMFVRLFARRLVDTGRVDLGDLYEEPFLRLGVDVDAAFPPADIEALFALAAKYEVA
jgi:type I restriction enzyme R subunit